MLNTKDNIDKKERVKFEIGFNNKVFNFTGQYSNNTYSIVTNGAKGVMRETLNKKLKIPFSLKRTIILKIG